MGETITAYRAINDRELDEMASLNGLTVEELLAQSGELDFPLHRDTNWDYDPNNWARLELDNGRKAIVRLVENVEGCDYTDSDHLTTGCNRMWAKDGHFIWLTAKVDARVKVTIERVRNGDTSDNSV